MSNAKYYDGSKFVKLGPDSPDDLGITKEFIESLGINKASMGLDLVVNAKQMPIAGGDFEGLVRAMTSNSLEPQMRNILFKAEPPLDTEGQDGDVCFVFTEEV